MQKHSQIDVNHFSDLEMSCKTIEGSTNMASYYWSPLTFTISCIVSKLSDFRHRIDDEIWPRSSTVKPRESPSVIFICTSTVRDSRNGNDRQDWNDLQISFKIIKTYWSKAVYDFLTVVCSKSCCITECFGDTSCFAQKPCFPYPTCFSITLWVKKTGPLFTAYNFRNIEQTFSKLGTNQTLFIL